MAAGKFTTGNLPTQNHKSSSLNLNVSGAMVKEAVSTLRRTRQAKGSAASSCKRWPSLLPLLLWLDKTMNPWSPFFIPLIYQAPSLLVVFWKSMLVKSGQILLAFQGLSLQSHPHLISFGSPRMLFPEAAWHHRSLESYSSWFCLLPAVWATLYDSVSWCVKQS